MEWLDRLNRAVDYIEANLDGKIDYERAAQIACCSTFHFQRMFSYIAGVPLSEYIRRRRMTAAAFDLQSTDGKVIDIALKYGYESPTAFNRAFQGVHGIAPSAARGEGVKLRAYPRISFKITIKGEAEMDYRIVKRDAFRIVGYRENIGSDVEESFKKVPLLWQKVFAENGIPPLLALMDGEPLGVMGVSACMTGKDVDYYIAVASGKPAGQGMSEYTVPACTWAVFECVGPMPTAMHSLEKRIVTEWLPTSGYEYADAPDIEVYGEGDQSAEDYRSEVWLPVVKKGS